MLLIPSAYLKQLESFSMLQLLQMAPSPIVFSIIYVVRKGYQPPFLNDPPPFVFFQNLLSPQSYVGFCGDPQRPTPKLTMI